MKSTCFLAVLVVFFSLTVTAAAQSARFHDNGDGTVTDLVTGLLWQKGDANFKTWSEAKAYCDDNAPGLPGEGWRLPGVRELSSLVDESKTENFKIDDAFDVSVDFYWSATERVGKPNFAFYINFSQGSLGTLDESNYNPLAVRCVRSGQ